jgi:hypothetical protein
LITFFISDKSCRENLILVPIGSVNPYFTWSSNGTLRILLKCRSM